MALVVNTNMQALNAQRNLDATVAQLGRAMTRLSSGLRINNASDDAAGLAISTRMGAQVRGLNQAIRNANDGVALLQTADGALAEIANILTRIKELAVQSANATNSASDRASLDDEVSALISEVTRIATQTKFGSLALLDGSYTAAFQVGAEVGQTVAVSVASFKASALTAAVASQDLTLTAAVDAVGDPDADSFTGVDSSTALQVSGPGGVAFIRQTTASDDTASYIEGAASAIALARAINESTSSTGVSASVTEASYTLGGTFANAIDIDGSTHQLTVNGQQVTVDLNGADAATRMQQLVDAVNAQVSGVAAEVSGGAVVLTAADGRNISVSATGTGANTVGGELFAFTTAVTAESVVARGGVALTAGGDITTTFSAPDSVGGDGLTAATSTALSTLSVSTVAASNTAMLVSDSLLDIVSTQRGELGALQNRLASTVANLSVVSEKLSDARSRILDADFAAETAALVRAQILQQAGISVLAQANQSPQAALALLPR